MKIIKRDLERERIDKEILFLDLSNITCEKTRQKILASRIQLLDGAIYTVGRKGPANFAEVPDLNLLGELIDEDSKITGIKIKENKELKNIIIVGRRIKNQEDIIIELEIELPAQ